MDGINETKEIPATVVIEDEESKMEQLDDTQTIGGNTENDSSITTKSDLNDKIKYNRRASATDASIPRTTEWRMLDLSELPTNIWRLSKIDRMKLYNRVSKNYTITTTNNNQYCQSVIGLSHPKIASIPCKSSFLEDLSTILFVGLFQLSYSAPVMLTIIGCYLFFYNYCYYFYLFCIIYLILIFYPHTDWNFAHVNPLFFQSFKYFSYRVSYHPSTQEYILKLNKMLHIINPQSSLNSSNNNNPIENANCILIAVPHGIQPLATSLSPPVTPDIFGSKFRSAGADIVMYLPLIRTFFLWWGLVSVSKKTLLHRLSIGENIALVPDGISGMFVNNKKNECLLLKNRKGVAKLALNSGCHIIPTYGFGNTIVYDGYFDPWGYMKFISRKLKMSLIAFVGRWGTTIPKKMPLYYTIGPIVKNKFAGKKIQKPTQEQIDELHEQVLDGLKQLFDTHKHLYGWSNKELKIM